MPVLQSHSAVKHFNYPFREADIEKWSAAQQSRLGGTATFALLFCSTECAAHMDELMEIVRIYGHVFTIVGCTGTGLIAGSREIENDPGVSIALYHLPNTRAHAHHISSCLTPDTMGTDPQTSFRQT